jgi:hypothetical protein
LTWKAVFLGETGSLSPLGGVRPGSLAAALSKSSALPDPLRITKTGFRDATYQPNSDADSDAVITMAAVTDTGLTYDLGISEKILSFDRVHGSFATERIDSVCDIDDYLFADTVNDTTRYGFSDNKMYLWTEDGCQGSSFTGSGTDPVGTWTLQADFTDLPSDLRTPDCSSDPAGDDFSYFNYKSVVYHIAETSISTNEQVEFCAADFYGPVFGQRIGEDTSITMTKNTCLEIDYRNGKGESATLTFSKKDDSLQGVFAYLAKTCTFKEKMSLSDNATRCPEVDPLEDFSSCAQFSGFLVAPAHSHSDSGLLKSSARRHRASYISRHGWSEPAFGR